MERAMTADSLAVTAEHAVEWWDTQVFQPWLAQFGRTTHMDRLRLENVTYPNDPRGMPIIPQPPPHTYVRTMLELYTAGLDDSAIMRLLRRIQSTLPKDVDWSRQFDEMCYDAGEGKRDFTKTLAQMERVWAIYIQKQTSAGGVSYHQPVAQPRAAFVAQEVVPMKEVEALVAKMMAEATGGVKVKPEHGPKPTSGDRTKYCAAHGWNYSHMDADCRRHKTAVKKEDKGNKRKERKNEAKPKEAAKAALPMDATAMVAEMKKMVLETVHTVMAQRPPVYQYTPQVCEHTPPPQQQAGGGALSQ
jgi:hypothetical protein